MSTEQLNSLLSEYGHLMYSAGMDSASAFLERRRTGVETEAKAQGIRARLQAELEARGKDAEGLRQVIADALTWVESGHRPPVRDVPEFGRYVCIRLHALASLQEAIDTALSKGAQEGVKG